MDVASWPRFDERLLRWATRLKAAGLQTAILSNMPSDVLAEVREQERWFALFDVTIFSCEVGCVKPEAAIYQRFLEALRVSTEEVLLIDDAEDNQGQARILE